MFNLDLSFDELLEDIFSLNQEKNESKVEQFCDEILNEKL